MRTLFVTLLLFIFAYLAQSQDITPSYYMMGWKVQIVSIESSWVVTDVNIEIGDTFNIIATGIANSGGKNPLTYYSSAYWVGPEGTGYAGSGQPVEGVPAYSLIGRIGVSGTPFYIGRSISFVANVSGVLYLGYNDVQFWDNYGYYIAYVRGGIITSIKESAENPNRFSLYQNYPNPFNPSTTIEYQVSKRSNVEVTIYDIDGRLVKTLLNSVQYPGQYSIQWNGQNDNGNMVSSGTYFYQISSDDNQLVKKMLLLK